MPYQFFQVVGLEKPADLRRARQSLVTCHDANVTCWVDPLDQVVWLYRADRDFSSDEISRTVRQLDDAGFTVSPLDQSESAGPTCIALHRCRRQCEILHRLVLTIALAVPVLIAHIIAGRLIQSRALLLALAWIQLAISAAVLVTAGRAWLRFGAWSLVNRRWRWRTGLAAVLTGTWVLALIDVAMQSAGHPGLLPLRPPTQNLCAPMLVVLAVVLLRALLMRWRLAQLSQPFDDWLSTMTETDETRLRFFLRTQARHQRAGLDLSIGRLADRFPNVGLIVSAAVFVGLLVLWRQLIPAWLTAAGLLLILDPRLFQFTWVAPEVLAERQAVGLGAFYGNPRVFGRAARLDVIVFDKTGTVTTAPAELVATEINQLAALDLTSDRLLQLAASVEQGWPHVVARSLVAAAEAESLPLLEVHNVQRRFGLGIAGDVAGRRVRVGSEFYLNDEGIDLASFATHIEALKRQPYSVVLVSVDDQLAGAIALADVLRPGSELAVSELARTMSVRMLTGDSAAAGAQLAANLAIREVFVELDPPAKIALLQRWRKAGEHVGLVATLGKDQALSSAADVSIVMTGTTLDVDRHAAAAEHATDEHARRSFWQDDIIVLDEQIERIPTALRLAAGVRTQRRLGYTWTAMLVLLSAAVAILWPMMPAVAEWAPAVVATLTLAGLPVILGRTAISARNGRTV